MNDSRAIVGAIAELTDAFTTFAIDHNRFREDVLAALGKIVGSLAALESDGRETAETLRAISDTLERIDDGVNPSMPDDEFPILKA